MLAKNDEFSPHETVRYMIDRASKRIDEKDVPDIVESLKHLENFVDDEEKGRWLGYYQSKGESIGLWTLDEIQYLVNDEIVKYDQREERAFEVTTVNEPISPRCPKCHSSGTTTDYHDGLIRNNIEYNQCHLLKDEHFDHHCKFCGYFWHSPIDLFVAEPLT